MTAYEAVNLALVLATFVALVFVAIRFARPRASLVGRTIVVNTKSPDDQAIRGILIAEHADRLTLREAFVVTGGIDQPAGGLVHIPRGAVAWIQEIEG